MLKQNILVIINLSLKTVLWISFDLEQFLNIYIYIYMLHMAYKRSKKIYVINLDENSNLLYHIVSLYSLLGLIHHEVQNFFFILKNYPSNMKN